MCLIRVFLPLTGRCSSPRKVINLWLFGAQLLGLIRGLSKNDQLNETKIFVISNYFGQFFLYPKTSKIFSLIFKNLENLKSLRIVSQFSTQSQILQGKSHIQRWLHRQDKDFVHLFSIFCQTFCGPISKVIFDFVRK